MAAGYNVEDRTARWPIKRSVCLSDHTRARYGKPDKTADDGKFVLVLRSRGKTDKTNMKSIVVSQVMYGSDQSIEGPFTKCWPLRNASAPVSEEQGSVVVRSWYCGTGTTATKSDQVAFRDAGWTGVGYKRNAEATAQRWNTRL